MYGMPMHWNAPCPYGYPVHPMHQMQPQQYPGMPFAFSSEDLARWSAEATPAPTLPCLNNPRGTLSVPKMEPQHRPRLLKGRCLDCGKIAQPNAVKCSCHGVVNGMARKAPAEVVQYALSGIMADVERYDEHMEGLRQIIEDRSMSPLELGAVIYKFACGKQNSAEVCKRVCVDVCAGVGENGGDFKRGLKCVCKEGLTGVIQGVQYRDDGKSECSSLSSGYGGGVEWMSGVLEFVSHLYLAGIIEPSQIMWVISKLVDLAEEGAPLALELLMPLLRNTSHHLSTSQPYHGQLINVNKRLHILRTDSICDY
eukprot:TRINITY_DN361_c0_g1_i1.p1 TRINITY_DN361_c0_g1~~TRINITY_DN361_c0_g1_i1.p1  ORF type:complete len:332 (+),score=36.36 TRINITY_DN361_c0_g1_i1:64-996(+)